MNKSRTIVTTALIGVALVFSVSKILFLSDLARLSLVKGRDEGKAIEILAKNYLKNQRLSSSLEKDERFLASFVKEIIKQDKSGLLRPKPAGVLELILDKFPENPLLDHLGLYKTGGKLKDWQNFDLLFFNILDDQALNAFSYESLLPYFEDSTLSDETFQNLILYLNWKKNFSQAEKFLNWGKQQEKISPVQAGLLNTDWKLRQERTSQGKEQTQIGLNSLKEKLKSRCGLTAMEIELGQNFIQEGSFSQEERFQKYWNFSDMSDKEFFSKGSFCGGLDSLEQSLRVMGFFTQEIPERDPARGGFWYREDIPLKEAWYLLYFRYKTHGESEKPCFWLANALDEYELPPAGREWKEVFYVLNNKHKKLAEIRPLLRMFGTGSVWFDGIYLSEIKLQGIDDKDYLLIID